MKKHFHKGLQLLLAAALITVSVATVASPATAGNALKEGDYVQFGKYLDKPILWRVVDFDASGDPLLLSDKIIDVKAFDAMGDHKYANGGTGSAQEFNGYSNWEMSNIRAWLNSDASAGNVQFPCGNPPVANALRVPMAYDQEKGFLADGNFSKGERALIKSVAQKSILSNVDNADSDGGTALYTTDLGGSFDSNGNEYLDIKNAMKNYDKAYYKNVTDKVFYLDVKQAYDVYSKFGAEYIQGRLNQGVADKANKVEVLRGGTPEYKENSLYSTKLRTPCGFEDLVYNVCENGIIGSWYPFFNGDAVRPALYLNLASVKINGGSGTQAAPYVAGADEPAATATTSVTSSKVYVNGKPVAFDAYNINKNNYFMLRDLAMVVNGTDKNFAVAWDGGKNAINLISKSSYVPVGSELKIGAKGSKTARLSTSTIYRDGKEIPLTAYNIGGNNYFKLRDIAKAFDIGITWDAKNNSIGIDTTISYTE